MLWYGKLLPYVVLLPHVVRCFSHGSYRPGQYSTARSVRRSIVSCSPFIAVLRNVDVDSALEVVHALCEAGFAMVSVTADTPGFESILRALSSEEALEGLIVGASSVTSPEQVRKIMRRRVVAPSHRVYEFCEQSCMIRVEYEHRALA